MTEVDLPCLGPTWLGFVSTGLGELGFGASEARSNMAVYVNSRP